MRLAMVGWIVAMIMAVSGLVAALRGRALVAAILIPAALALGLISATDL